MSSINEAQLPGQFARIRRLPGFVNPPIHRLFAAMGALGAPAGEILEIGVFGGQSLLSLACAFPGRACVGVDPFFDDFHNPSALAGEDDIMQSLTKGQNGEARLAAIKSAARDLQVDKVRLEPCTQEAYFSRGISRNVALLHLDGEHTFPAVKAALDKVPDLMVPGAWVVLDDFPHNWYPGIVEALYTHPLFRHGLEPVACAYGKGLFAWQADAGEIERRRKGLSLAFDPQLHAVNRLHDGSYSIQSRPVSAGKSGWLRRVGRLLMRIGSRLSA